MNSDTIPTKHGYLIIGEPLPKELIRSPFGCHMTQEEAKEIKRIALMVKHDIFLSKGYRSHRGDKLGVNKQNYYQNEKGLNQ